jgi:hypothetical protein
MTQRQQQMDAAVDKYFAMSEILQSDMEALLADGSDTQSSRRNFIRAAASLIEGYTHCFREMCQVGLATGAVTLTPNEASVLTTERGFGSAERTKLTIRATYKLFELPEVPDFGVRGWQGAVALLDKRDSLMHPKSVEDLDVSEAQRHAVHEGAIWILKQLFGFMSQLARVHGIASLVGKA